MAKNDRELNTPIIIFIGMIIFFLLLALIILFARNEEHITMGYTDTNTFQGLYCKGNVVNAPFFAKNDANEVTHEIKVIFVNDKIDKINYTFTGTYDSEKQATDASAVHHANYNIYMSQTSIDQEALQPTFSIIGNKSVINMSVDYRTLTSETAKIVLLDSEQFNNLEKYSNEDVFKLYEQKGFHCELTK